MKTDNIPSAPSVATKPERERLITIFDCAETFEEALILAADAKKPLNMTIENKGKYWVINWIEKYE